MVVLTQSAAYGQTAASDPGTDARVFIHDGWVGSPGLPDVGIRSISQDENGYLWLASEVGAIRFGGMHFGVVDSLGLPPDDMPSTNNVRRVFGDSEGRLWIGLVDGGMVMRKDDVYSRFEGAQAIDSESVLDFAESPGGIIWIATERSGLFVLDGSLLVPFKSSNLPSQRIADVEVARDGTVWIATVDGLFGNVRGRIERRTVDDGLASHDIVSLAHDSNNSLWIGTRAGLHVMRNGEIESVLVPGFPADRAVSITALHGSTDGSVWVGTEGFGVYFFDGTSWTSFGYSDGLSGETVFAIFEDIEHSIWVGTNRGLDRFMPATSSVATVTTLAAESASRVRNETIPPVTIEHVYVNGYEETGVTSLPKGTDRIEFDYAALSFVNPTRMRYTYQLDGFDSDWVEAGSQRSATYTNLPGGSYVFRVRASNSDGVWNNEGAEYRFKIEPFAYERLGFWVLIAVTGLLAAALIYFAGRVALGKRFNKLEATLAEKDQTIEFLKGETERQIQTIKSLKQFKTRFFANISHQFRTPLTLTIGPLENALAGNFGHLGAAMRAQVDIMLRNSKRLLRLVNQLLDVATLEAGKVVLNVRTYNASNFVEGIVHSFTSFAAERKLNLEFENRVTDPDLTFDSSKIEKVLFNLLSNAIKFTSKGSIVVALDDRPDTNEVEISVADTGCGIEEKEIPFLFDRYRNFEGSIESIRDGSGIGLSLVKELVDLHDGRIEVESQVGSGSVFRIILKRGTDHYTAAELNGDSARRRIQGSEEISRVAEFVDVEATDRDADNRFTFDDKRIPEEASHILIVCDNSDMRDHIKSCLYPDYFIHEASSAAAAVKRLDSLKPELIISDAILPDMEGQAFSARVKEQRTFENLPILFLTARASTGRNFEGLVTGADDYLSKPFSARELRARTNNLIRLRRLEQQVQTIDNRVGESVESQLQLVLNERRAYEEELIRARDSAEESARLRAAILKNISHECRTPLTTILGFSQMLQRDAKPEHVEYALHIEKGGKRLLDALGTIDEWTHIESGEISVDCRPTAFEAVVRETCKEFEPRAKAKKLELSVLFDRGNLSANIDPKLLSRVLGSLLDNAIRFTDQGRIVVQTYNENGRVVVAVSDTGEGISDKFRPFLFEAFRKDLSRPIQRESGNGLGLTIARRLVELLQGEIEVQSKIGSGSTFSVSFEECRMDAGHAGRPPVRPAKSSQVSSVEAGSFRAPGRRADQDN